MRHIYINIHNIYTWYIYIDIYIYININSRWWLVWMLGLLEQAIIWNFYLPQEESCPTRQREIDFRFLAKLNKRMWSQWLFSFWLWVKNKEFRLVHDKEEIYMAHPYDFDLIFLWFILILYYSVWFWSYMISFDFVHYLEIRK